MIQWGFSSHVLIFFCALFGFACLACAMERHQTDLWARVLSARVSRLLRYAGWGWLCLCLIASIRNMGWGFGMAAFSGHTSFAAALVLLGLLSMTRWKESQRKKRTPSKNKAAS